MNQTFILLTLSLPLVHNLAANHRQHAMGLQNLHLRNLHDVGREHGEVSELANFDRAAQLLFKRHVGGPDSEHLERLLARYGLFRMPAFARKPAHIPARDGSVKFDHWFAAFDRRVRAAGNNHAAFKKTLPRVGPVKPLDAETASSGLTGPTDRKSTRLNSSHVRISYAVFCLKKKQKPVHALTAPAPGPAG